MEISMIDPLKAAAHEALQGQKAAMRSIVGGMSSEGLNWKPAGPGGAGGSETNSIAQMLSHALEAERFLVLTAIDEQMDRNREAQFQVMVNSAEEMIEQIDRTEQEVNEALDRLTADHLGQEISRTTRTRTGAWWLLHAIEHSNEHVGQASLTRQLYERSVG